jgi:hypothetical protein
VKNFLQIKSRDEYSDFLRDFQKLQPDLKKEIVLAMKQWLDSIHEAEKKRPAQEQTNLKRRSRRPRRV